MFCNASFGIKEIKQLIQKLFVKLAFLKYTEHAAN